MSGTMARYSGGGYSGGGERPTHYRMGGAVTPSKHLPCAQSSPTIMPTECCNNWNCFQTFHYIHFSYAIEDCHCCPGGSNGYSKQIIITPGQHSTGEMTGAGVRRDWRYYPDVWGFNEVSKSKYNCIIIQKLIAVTQGDTKKLCVAISNRKSVELRFESCSGSAVHDILLGLCGLLGKKECVDLAIDDIYVAPYARSAFVDSLTKFIFNTPSLNTLKLSMGVMAAFPMPILLDRELSPTPIIASMITHANLTHIRLGRGFRSDGSYDCDPDGPLYDIVEEVHAPSHQVGDEFGSRQVELMNNIMITESSTEVLEIYYPCITFPSSTIAALRDNTTLLTIIIRKQQSPQDRHRFQWIFLGAVLDSSSLKSLATSNHTLREMYCEPCHTGGVEHDPETPWRMTDYDYIADLERALEINRASANDKWKVKSKVFMYHDLFMNWLMNLEEHGQGEEHGKGLSKMNHPRRKWQGRHWLKCVGQFLSLLMIMVGGLR